MKFKLILLFMALLVLGCSEDDPFAENLDQSFYENSAISSNYPYVGAGTSIVFHRYFQEEDNPQIADDEYAEDFMIELPSDADYFEITGDQLGDIPILFNQYCYCAPIDFVQFTDGQILGQRKGSNWELDVDVEFRQGFINAESGDTVYVDTGRKTFSGLFLQKARP